MLRQAVRPLIVVALAVCFSSAPIQAAIVTFNLLDPSGTGGTAGEAFEAGNPFSLSGLTISASVATTLGLGTGEYSANASSAGVDSDGIIGTGGDSASEIDAGETLFLTLSFADAFVRLDSVNFAGVGSDASDSADVARNSISLVSLFTGVTDFNGSSDVWTPGSGVPVSSGDTFAFTASDRIALESIAFEITAVPEPSSFVAIACVGLIGGACSRRRRQQAATIA